VAFDGEEDFADDRAEHDANARATLHRERNAHRDVLQPFDKVLSPIERVADPGDGAERRGVSVSVSGGGGGMDGASLLTDEDVVRAAGVGADHPKDQPLALLIRLRDLIIPASALDVGHRTR